MYDIKLFKDIQFPKGKLYEDNGTTYKLIMKCPKIVYTNQSLYNYHIRKTSITSKEFSIKKMDYIYLTEEECDVIEKKFPQLSEECRIRRAIAKFSVLRQMLNKKLNKEEKELENQIIEDLKNEYKNLKKNKYMNKKLKWSFKLLLIDKQILKLGAKIYERVK